MADIIGGLLGYERQKQEITQLSLENQSKQINIEKQQQEAARQEQINQILKQQQQAPSAPLMSAGTTASGQTDVQSNTASMLMQTGQGLLGVDPQAGIALIKQGGEIQKNALEANKLQLANQAAQLKQAATWANQVTDQQSLNDVRAQVEAQYPGQWDAMKLPTTFDGNANTFKRLGESTMTELQKVDLKLKQIDLQTRAEFRQNQLAQQRANIVRTNVGIEKVRNGKVGGGGDKAYDKYVTALEKEDIKYASTVASRRKQILSNTDKYPDEIPKVSLIQQWFGTEQPTETQQDAALRQAEAEEQQAHADRLAAIERSYSMRTGAPLPSSGSKGASGSWGTPKSTPTKPVTNKQQYQEGQVYTDAAGNRAKYVNGNWEEL